MNTNDKSNSSMRSWLWVIRGSPGVGKSAVGRRLKNILPDIAIIEVDVLRSMQSNVDWKSKESHHLGLDAAALVARSFHENGIGTILVIDTLLGERLDHFIAQVGIDLEIITLVAKEEVLVKRALGRDSGFKDRDTTVEMNSWFLNNRLKDEIVIDTTEINADEVAVKIAKMIIPQGIGSPPRASTGIAKKKKGLEIPTTASGQIVLVRHASPDRKFSGPYNIVPGPGLSDKGLEQAKSLEQFFTEWKIDRWVTSPFERARQTALQISNGRASLEESDNWAEVGPSEPFREVKKRVAAWLENNVPCNGQTLLIVAHGASINAAIELLAPDLFKQIEKDKHGLIIGKGEAWIVKFDNGVICNCKLIFPNYLE